LEIHFHVKSMFLKNEEFDAFITGARDEGKAWQI